MPFSLTNDLLQHYQIEGKENAPTLVLCNSLGTDFRIWDAIIPALAEHYRILRYDKRGHGLSDCTPAPYSIDLLLQDLLALLDHLNIKKNIICGLSVGGMIAQAFAARYPDRTQAVILCNTAARIGTAESWDERITMIKDKGLSAISAMVMERWFTPEFHENRKEELRAYSNMLERTPAEGYIGVCQALAKADLREACAKIQRATLVVGGDQDGSTPPDVVENLALSIKGAHFSLIQRAGHIPCVEQADILSNLMIEFLRENDLV